VSERRDVPLDEATIREWYEAIQIVLGGSKPMPMLKEVVEAAINGCSAQEPGQTRNAALEEAAVLVESLGKSVGEAESQYHGYDKHGHGDLASQYAFNIRALKDKP